MKYSLASRKCLGLVLGSISALALTGVLSSSLASAEPYTPQTTTPIESFGTGAEVPVPPWCTWHSSIPENVLLSPVDDPTGAIAYRGDAINLSFNSDWNYTYVGGETGLTSKAGSNKCSWFGDPAYGSKLDVTTTGNTFNAYIVSNGALIADTAMNFDVGGGNNFTLARSLDPACLESGNSFLASNLSTNLFQTKASVPIILTQVLASSTKTNNFCKWKASYTLKLPAGLEPTYTRADYAWIGPQMIYTLSFPAE